MVEVYSKAKDGKTKITENFMASEFACGDGSDPIFIDTHLVAILQKIRDHFKKPVIVNSGYRTPAYNKRVGGITYSEHIYGRAADIRISGVTPAQIASYAEELMGKTGGIGTYSDFVHIDVGANYYRWKG